MVIGPYFLSSKQLRQTEPEPFIKQNQVTFLKLCITASTLPPPPRSGLRNRPRRGVRVQKWEFRVVPPGFSFFEKVDED